MKFFLCIKKTISDKFGDISDESQFRNFEKSYGNKNDDNNAINSKNVLTYNSNGNVIRIKNQNKAAVIDGLKDYIIVDTEKALLICPRENDQLIKDYVLDLKNLKKGERFM